MTSSIRDPYEPLTHAEERARQLRMAPGPFQDAVTGMFVSGVSVGTTAQYFKISVREVSGIVRWVCDTNLRRLVKTPAPWDRS